ncbi:hypothetical protein CH352_04245 [Leptospira hartskeerlii]|uniref:DUF1554 domain-containing protein n=1 Tax=Leptospira hartskeerlii TaxID=2023177 RepID=A0A2M9XGJ8_9LEPT|nr:DUF1554 domain-containing protein [Leptospira hartskeerlii]PJZ26702.1 hypothetical protein CH357_04210 [Leptospira hartskeerlii]PJZ34816.1 hypothetical protein CH352_04245 [Leptospira hartskeerlii]
MALRIYTLILILSGLFSSACSKPFPGGDEIILLGLLGKTRYLFVTTSTNTGNLGGVGGADLICQSAKTSEVPSLPGSALEYVALIASSSRVPGGAGWPLFPNTNYYAMNPSETLIFHTDGSGLPVLPMNNATGIPGAGDYWTGISNSGSGYGTGTTCSDWMSANAAVDANNGSPNQNTETAFDSGFATTCDTPLHLLCVRN